MGRRPQPQEWSCKRDLENPGLQGAQERGRPLLLGSVILQQNTKHGVISFSVDLFLQLEMQWRRDGFATLHIHTEEPNKILKT